MKNIIRTRKGWLYLSVGKVWIHSLLDKECPLSYMLERTDDLAKNQHKLTYKQNEDKEFGIKIRYKGFEDGDGCLPLPEKDAKKFCRWWLSEIKYLFENGGYYPETEE